MLSGVSFPEFLKAELLDPLGLQHTGCDLPHLVIPNRASGYEGGPCKSTSKLPGACALLADFDRLLVVAAGPLSDNRGRAGPELQPAPPIFAPVLTGGGSMYSTVEDLQLWDASCCGGALLSASSLAALETLHAHRDEATRYGYGWQGPAETRDDGRIVLRHGGGLPGFTTHILRLKVPGRLGPSDVCVAICSNVHSGGLPGVANALAAACAEQVL